MAAVALFAERLLARHSVHEIAEAIEVLVDVLDMLGGDPEAEETGDEQDGSFAEDEPATCFATMGSGPGCDIADGGEDSDSDYCLASEDRGTGGYMPPALFSGYASAAIMNDCDDDERNSQPLTLNPV
jgi:hypothetical protein